MRHFTPPTETVEVNGALYRLLRGFVLHIYLGELCVAFEEPLGKPHSSKLAEFVESTKGNLVAVVEPTPGVYQYYLIKPAGKEVGFCDVERNMDTSLQRTIAPIEEVLTTVIDRKRKLDLLLALTRLTDE